MMPEAPTTPRMIVKKYVNLDADVATIGRSKVKIKQLVLHGRKLSRIIFVV